MAVRTDFVAGEVLAAQDLDDTFAAKIDYALPVNTQTGTTYTFVLADGLRLTTANNASASTFTVPPQADVVWLANSVIRLVNFGAGVVTIDGGSGVTVTNTAATVAQFQSVDCIRTGSDAWTVVVAGGGDESGLVHINTTSVTTTSTISFNSVFSATFQNYKVIIIGVASTSTFMNLRMRVAGVDASGSDYNRQALNGFSTTASAFRETTTSFRTIARGNTTSYGGIFDILRPFDATATAIFGQGACDGIDTDINSGNHSLSTSHDGFTLLQNSGTFTGTIRVFGYKNS